MKFEDFITAHRYINFTCSINETMTVGRRKLKIIIYREIMSEYLPKRFPRKILADVVSMMDYHDRATGFTLRPRKISVDRQWSDGGLIRVSVSGNILNSRGRRVGEVRRSFCYSRGGKPKHIVHGNLKLTRGNQGNGFARRYLNWAKREYALRGFDHVKVYAAAGSSYNGSYTWARLGFTPDKNIRYNGVAFDRALEEARNAVSSGKLSPCLLARAEKLIENRDGNALVQLARLGARSKYRTNRGHLGKELILAATDGWDGKMQLDKVS